LETAAAADQLFWRQQQQPKMMRQMGNFVALLCAGAQPAAVVAAADK
jgi:hypothetical protein